MAGVSPDNGQPARRPAASDPLELLRDAGGLGRLRRLAQRLLGNGPDLVLVVEPGWDLGADTETVLANALAGSPGATFACAHWKEHEGACRIPDVSLAALLLTPRPAGPLMLRRPALAAVGLPDFGPADAVLDAAAGWALATAILARGGNGFVVPQTLATRVAPEPESPDALTPEGRAWLAREAMAWLPGGTPSPALAAALWSPFAAAIDHRGLAPAGWWEAGE
jgi:hypothetical protein